MTTDRDEIKELRQRLYAIEIEREQLVARVRDLEIARMRFARDEHEPGARAPATAPTVTNTSPAADKIALFRGLFACRTDVFPFRWENAKTGRSGYAPACANEWLRGVCGKPQVKCGECPNPAFIPVSDEVIECHLRGEDRVRPSGHGGDLVAGVYPLLFDDTCKFLAVDFDGEQWSTDALAFMATCREVDAPAALERSRSGQGGHVWLFFAEPIAASEARRLGTMLLTQTMNRRPEIGFKSYDRLFPSRDTMPSGGFGNLIALPLQRLARENGNSVFVDADLQPYPDQWAFLSGLRRLTAADVVVLSPGSRRTCPAVRQASGCRLRMKMPTSPGQ